MRGRSSSTGRGGCTHRNGRVRVRLTKSLFIAADKFVKIAFDFREFRDQISLLGGGTFACNFDRQFQFVLNELLPIR